MDSSYNQSRLNEDETAEQLMTRVKERDERALAELHRRHAPLVRGIFEINRGKVKVRVLAYNQGNAERLAREYSEHEFPTEEGPSLFDGF